MNAQIDNGVMTKKAMAADTGMKTYTCTKRSATYMETIPATGEEPADNPFTDVEYTEDTSWYCDVALWSVDEGGALSAVRSEDCPPSEEMTLTFAILWFLSEEKRMLQAS